MWAKVSILGYHMTPQEFSGKLKKGIVRSKFWGRKRRSLTWAVLFLIVLNLTYHPRYNARVTMLSVPSPKHCQYQFFYAVQSLRLVWLSATPCTARTPGSLPFKLPTVFSNPWPLSQWCFAVILCSVLPFSSCPKSLPESVSFSMSQLFAWGGQSIGVSASASVLPMNTQDWSPLVCSGWGYSYFSHSNFISSFKFFQQVTLHDIFCTEVK